MASKTKVILQSADGEKFEVDKKIAELSTRIKRMITQGQEENPIPVPNVSGPVLAKIVYYWEQQASGRVLEGEDESMKQDLTQKFEAIMAVRYIDNGPLLYFLYEAFADTAEGMTGRDLQILGLMYHPSLPSGANSLGMIGH